MEQYKVFDNLYMFNTLNKFINLSFNQYLMPGEAPLLVHTGSIELTEQLIPKIKDLLGNQALSYIFVSHFESDECGGLNLLLESFPQAKTICSQITARQLLGFGFKGELVVKNPGDTLETKDYSLSFIGYPSEMHLWEGLLAVENKQGLLFSSDLFIRFGSVEDTIVSANWEDEVKGIAVHQIPSPTAYEAMQKTLLSLPLNYVVPGHGPILKLK